MEQTTYCAVHPDRETALRCNKCARYMCVQCAVQTPVGYRCRECVRGHDKQFFRGTSRDGVVIGVLCLLLSAITCFVLQTGGLFFAVILGLPAGAFIGELAMRAVGHRRGLYDDYVGTVAALLGGLLGAGYQALSPYLPLLTNVRIGWSTRERLLSSLGAELWVSLAVTVAIIAFGVYLRLRIKRTR